MDKKNKKTGIESKLDCMQPSIDSGATPIGSASRAPDKIPYTKKKATHVATNLKIRRKGRSVDVGQVDSLEKRRGARVLSFLHLLVRIVIKSVLST